MARIPPLELDDAPPEIRERYALQIQQQIGVDADQTRGVFRALQIARHFAAQESAGDGMLGVAAQARGFAVLDGDQDRAGVRAVEGADGVTQIGHLQRIIASGVGRKVVGRAALAV